ncbi:MAG: hypothetical protein JJT85_05700 [Chromatiales bacterium]|nr:hypothetical protein [Chromatiales bacterium]
MSAHEFWLIIHLLLFCYWLGGDMGVYYSSGMVIDPKLSREGRLTAAKIMVNLDLVPRICMALMLTVGGILSSQYVEHRDWQWPLIIAIAPVWLAMVLIIHAKEGTEFGRSVARVDRWFRWIVVISICASVGYAFAFESMLDSDPWVGFKLLVFAGLVFCGLMIRQFIGGYVVGIHKLAQGEPTDAENRAMAESLAKCRYFVIAIWIGLLLQVVLGVVKPGGA